MGTLRFQFIRVPPIQTLDATAADLMQYSSIFSNEDEVVEFLFEGPEFFLKYFPAEWMNGFKVMGVYKDLIKNTAILFESFEQFVGGCSIKIPG